MHRIGDRQQQAAHLDALIRAADRGIRYPAYEHPGFSVTAPAGGGRRLKLSVDGDTRAVAQAPGTATR